MRPYTFISRHFIVFALAISTLTFATWSGQSNAIAADTSKAAPRVHIYSLESPPIAFFQNGQPNGFAVDIAHEIAQRLNETIDITIGSQSDIEDAFTRYPTTAHLSLLRTDERDALYKWVGPLLPQTLTLYALRDNIPENVTLESIKNVSRIAAVQNSDARNILLAHGFSNLSSSRSQTQCADDLKYGRAQLWLSTPLLVPEAAHGANIPLEDIVSVATFTDISSYIAFTLESDDSIVNAWQNTLDAIKRDGTFEIIKKRWFPTDQEDSLLQLTQKKKPSLPSIPSFTLA